MSQLLDDLRALDALFSDESKWTQGYLARDDRGETIKPFSEKAVCWCLDGGAMKVANGVLSHRYRQLRVALGTATPRWSSNYVICQDRHTHKFQQIKAIIARAIAAEEGRVGQ